MFRFSFVAALALAASLLQPAQAADTDQARLAAYRLDQATLAKVEAAIDTMADVVKKQPSLVHGKEGDVETIAGMAAFYDSRPPLKKAIEGAGLTTDAFSVFMMAWAQSLFAHAMIQTVPVDKRAKATADTGVPPANLAFVEANKDHLKKISDKLAAMPRGQ